MKKTLKNIKMRKPAKRQGSLLKKHADDWINAVSLVGSGGYYGTFTSQYDPDHGVYLVLISISWGDGNGVTISGPLVDAAQYVGKKIEQAWNWFTGLFSYTTPLRQKIPSGILASMPPLTNLAGSWKFDATDSKVTTHGAACSYMSLVNVDGYKTAFGIMKVSDGWGAFALYSSPREIRVTNLLPLPKADAYRLEIAIDPKNGQTTFWANNVGWDVGVLRGFKGGAHLAMAGAHAVHPSDHLLPGTFSNVMAASNGVWAKADLPNSVTRPKLARHIAIEHPATDSVQIRDRRSAIV